MFNQYNRGYMSRIKNEFAEHIDNVKGKVEGACPKPFPLPLNNPMETYWINIETFIVNINTYGAEVVETRNKKEAMNIYRILEGRDNNKELSQNLSM